MLSDYLSYWPVAFSLTVFVEALVALGLNKWQQWYDDMAFMGAFIIGNIMSHPFLWFVLPKLMPNYTTHLVFGETFVYVFEAFIYYLLLPKISFRRAILISTIQNTASLAIGLWINNAGI